MDNQEAKRRKDMPLEAVLHRNNDTLRVIAAGMVAIAVALTGMGLVSAAITRNAVVTKLKHTDLRYMARAISATIEGRIDKAVDASLLTAADPALSQWIASGDADEASGWTTRQKLAGLVKNFGNDTAFLVSSRSRNYWTYDAAGFRLLDVISENDPDDRWFFENLAMGRKYQINIDYNKELNDTFVFINVLVGDISAPMAVTGVGMNLGTVVRELVEEDAENGVTSDVWLSDGTGAIYLSKEAADIGRPLNGFLTEALAAEILGAAGDGYTTTEYTDAAGAVYDVIYKQIRDTDWSLVIRIPRSESVGFLSTVLFNTAVAGLLIIAIVALLFQVLSRRIADPYRRAVELNNELERIVAQRTSELADRNRSIQDSIDYARTLQTALLPSGSALSALLGEHFALWCPRDTVGGDFYWVRPVPGGVLAVVGDCTGHGVPGALMTMSVTAMLDHIADEICHDDPAQILTELGRLIGQTFTNRPAGAPSDGLDAAVLHIGPDKAIRFAGARLSLLTAGPDGVQEYRGTRRTLDALGSGSDRPFETRLVRPHPGAMAYVATDGYYEQPGGARGLPMGRERMKQWLAEASGLPAEAQHRRLYEALMAYAGPDTLRDDVTLLGFRIG